MLGVPRRDDCWSTTTTLEPGRVIDTLQSAVARLATEAVGDDAHRVLAGVMERSAVLARRCDELPRILAETQRPDASPVWS